MWLLNHESIITHMSEVGECKKLCKLISIKWLTWLSLGLGSEYDLIIIIELKGLLVNTRINIWWYLIKTYIWWRLGIKSNRVLALQKNVVSLLAIKNMCDNNVIAKR